jgi:hypothetical protein
MISHFLRRERNMRERKSRKKNDENCSVGNAIKMQQAAK